jgi:hypothetical protein
MRHGIIATPTVLVGHRGKSLRLVGDLDGGGQLQELLRLAAGAA